ncbi:MAG: ribosomal L7Ae/L30e/S12e/Gadd45 family protein [Schleiferilactobacillus perolens]|nr:ribosomal L7Ae/L30e/S12e/Gadd45 family protein [Schleiferilactobacillus perolens]MCI1892121.1 ribosomal L7Ae/L30e/S12e/Gadd45 family protein [Schleiferilactobacillus harbinensis]MCI1911721.1 ribosomal L7Ae/L30e/S12e/Gadd45 family protein [Schleiferilactobacillus harbinensis]
MNTQKLMNLIGLAQAASQLTAGEPQVLAAIRAKEAKLVILAADAGAATTKRITDKSAFYQIPLTQALTSMQIAQALGKPRKILAVTQAGFARSMEALM